MRRAILPSLLLAVLPAVAHAEPCAVTVSRAPDDVRAAIDAWVSAEPECATTADVRAVPTDGGFYLIAIDASGRVHERVVPDAQSAGVLVASWIADDGQRPARVPDEQADLEPFPARVAAVEAPGETAPVPALVATARPRKLERRQLAVGLAEEVEDLGRTSLRLEIDLVARGHWTGGVEATAWSTQITRGVDDVGWDGWNAAGLVGASYSRERGAWGVRLGGAVGLGGGQYRVMDGLGNTFVDGGHWWLGELGAAVTRHVTGAWSVAVGPRVTWALSGGGGGGDWTAFAAVRHTL